MDAKHTQRTGPVRRSVHLFDDCLCYDRNTDLLSKAFGITPSRKMPLASASILSAPSHTHPHHPLTAQGPQAARTPS